MPRRNYKFTNKKHPEKAVASTILGSVSLLGLLAVIYASFLADGGTKPGYGLTGLLAVIFSLAGAGLGIASFRERESFHFFCWLGTVMNLLILLGIGFLVFWGAGGF